MLPWWLRLRVAAQISAAIAYLHTLPASVGGPLIHRDIKPANMFLDGRLNAKVGSQPCMVVTGMLHMAAWRWPLSTTVHLFGCSCHTGALVHENLFVCTCW